MLIIIIIHIISKVLAYRHTMNQVRWWWRCNNNRKSKKLVPSANNNCLAITISYRSLYYSHAKKPVRGELKGKRRRKSNFGYLILALRVARTCV